MGWTETCAMDERMRFVLAAESGEETLRRCAGVRRQPSERLQVAGAI